MGASIEVLPAGAARCGHAMPRLPDLPVEPYPRSSPHSRGMALGAIITIAVQSSSITTSILIPMVAAGILTLKNAYPVTLGANLGTTATALLASLAAESPDALTIALIHTLFNVFGILLFYPVPVMREIPIRLATGIGDLAQRRKRWVVAYVGVAFIGLPLVGLVVLS